MIEGIEMIEWIKLIGIIKIVGNNQYIFEEWFLEKNRSIEALKSGCLGQTTFYIQAHRGPWWIQQI